MYNFPTTPTLPFGNFSVDIDDADFILFGVPMDERSTGRRAAYSGPDCIRTASTDLETTSLRFGMNYDELRVTDIGNVSTPDFDEALREVYEITTRIRQAGKKSVMLGGEHTFTLPAVTALKPRHLVVFDAHLDLRNEYMGETVSHTTYLRRICEEVRDLEVICLGFRGFCREEIEYASKRGILAVSSYELIDNFERTIELIEKRLNSGELYVSVDVDVLDPAFMNEVGNPEPEGLFPRILLDLFRALTGKKVVGFDVMELSPTSDWNPSHHLAAKIVYELMAATMIKSGSRV